MPIAQHHDRVIGPQYDFALYIECGQRSIRAQHGNGMSGKRASHRPGAHLPHVRAVADEEIRFGLSVDLVDAHTQMITSPRKRLAAQRLPAGHDRSQRDVVVDIEVGLAHHLEGGRRQERRRHPVFDDEIECPPRLETRTRRCDDRAAMEPRRDHRIEESADPGPVGGRPQPFIGSREEVEHQLESGQVAEQDPMAVQRPFGCAGRARGVDQQGRVVGRSLGRREIRRGRRDEVIEILIRSVAAVTDEDHGDASHLLGDLYDDVARRGIGDDDSGEAVAESISQCFGPEELRHRYRDRAQFVCRQMREPAFITLRKHDRDTVSALDAETGESVRQPVRALRQLAEGVFACLTIGDLDQRERRRILLIGAGSADVESLRQLPAEVIIQGLVCRSRNLVDHAVSPLDVIRESRTTSCHR